MHEGLTWQSRFGIKIHINELTAYGFISLVTPQSSLESLLIAVGLDTQSKWQKEAQFAIHNTFQTLNVVYSLLNYESKKEKN